MGTGVFFISSPDPHPTPLTPHVIKTIYIFVFRFLKLAVSPCMFVLNFEIAPFDKAF